MYKSIKDVLVENKEYVIEKLVKRFEKQSWSPYQEFMLKADYFRQRSEIFYTGIVRGLEGDTDLLFSDQKNHSFARAVQGFHVSNALSPQHLVMDIVYGLLQKLEDQGKLGFENTFIEVLKLDSLLLSVYRTIVVSHAKIQEEFLNKLNYQSQLLNDFMDRTVSQTDISLICNDFLNTISQLFEINEFVIVLYKDKQFLDTFSRSVSEKSYLGHIWPSIEKSLSLNVSIYEDYNGNVEEEDLLQKPLISVTIPFQCYVHMGGVLVLHNHGKEFSLTQKDIRLLNQFLHFLFLKLEDVSLLKKDNQKKLEVAPPNKNVTAREREILKQIAEGKSDQEIADLLFISIHTVRTHIRNLFKKIGVSSRSQAIVKSIQHQLFE